MGTSLSLYSTILSKHVMWFLQFWRWAFCDVCRLSDGPNTGTASEVIPAKLGMERIWASHEHADNNYHDTDREFIERFQRLKPIYNLKKNKQQINTHTKFMA